MKSVIKTPIKDLKIIELFHMTDERGSFSKTYNQSSLEKLGLPPFTIKESFFSFSKKGVVRGMHFQLPPHDHSKIVFVPKGAVLDVVVDLRKKSDTYGQHMEIELSDQNYLALYIPSGFAHGFQALEDDTLIYYLVSSEYAPAYDTGIHYLSCDIEWPLEIKGTSDRDNTFVNFDQFESPF